MSDINPSETPSDLNRRVPMMIMGCTSDAGKSFVAAILCRLFANKGVKVAPFKAQNMSNNAAVTKAGGEIGRAQYLQAIAAKQLPTVQMNPVLLKPQGDTLSQVVVEGKVDDYLNSIDWHARRDKLWPIVEKNLSTLIEDHELVVIEGAGSPAEVNLRQSDIVNMSVALACQADVYIVVDIDRGGAYAHLLGTYMCLAPEEQALVKGFVLNKFRGDASLLAPANEWIEQQTGKPVIAVLPYTTHTLPEEDNFFHRDRFQKGGKRIGLVCYPFASNLDEFDPLAYAKNINLVPIRSPEDMLDLDALVLPGSKHVGHSHNYLKSSGLDDAIVSWAQQGKPVLGICGGMQLLGNCVKDPDEVEGGCFKGLNLLPIETLFKPEKISVQRQVSWRGDTLEVYEIHHGRSKPLAHAQDFIEGLTGWQHQHVYGTYLHGVFENSVFLQWFLDLVGWKGVIKGNWKVHVNEELDRLAHTLSPDFEHMMQASHLRDN